MKSKIITAMLIAVLGIAGCKKYETGKVIRETGNIARYVESDFGDSSHLAGNPSYILQIKTDNGIYTASILPTEYRTLEALALRLKPGDIVKFVVNDSGDYEEEFGNDKIGYIDANNIEIVVNE